jgi:hypothetical protein
LRPCSRAASPSPPGAAVKPLSWRRLLRAFWTDVAALLRVPVFVPICAAWAAHTATVGCYSYYGPKAAKEIFNLDAADTVFGALTVCTGIAGTLAGGVVLDRWRASVPAALLFCAAVCAAGFILLMAAFQAPTLGSFIPLFALGELMLFSVNACVNAAVMWSVPLRLRSLAMSAATIAIHIFGDVPAPPLVGKFQDHMAATRGARPDNWRVSLGLVTCTLAASGVLFHLAAGIAKRQQLPGAPATTRGGGGEEGGGDGSDAAAASQRENGGGAGEEGHGAPLLSEVQRSGSGGGGGGVEDGSFFAPLPKLDGSAAGVRRAAR